MSIDSASLACELSGRFRELRGWFLRSLRDEDDVVAQALGSPQPLMSDSSYFPAA